MSLAPIKIQLMIDGAQAVSAALGKLVGDARQAFGQVSKAGESAAPGISIAERAIEQLTQRIDRSNAAFERLRASGKLTAEQLARVDTARAAKVEPLQAERTAVQVSDARNTLGIKPFADVQAEIAKVRKAYADLAASGKLSSAELAQANLKHLESVAALKAQTNGFAQSFLAVKESVVAVAASFVAFRAAAGAAIEFEAAMADVRKVVDASPAQFEQITRSIRDLSAELPITAVGLAQMAEAGGQLGIAGDKLPEFVRLAAEMSVGFKISADDAGNAVGKLSNIFGLSLPQVRNLADSINALGDSSAATERDIVAVLQRTGGLGRQFGLSAEQTSALAASFLSLGDPPEIAATAINNLLSKLQAVPAQSKEFQSTLKVLGIDAKQLGADIEHDAQGALIGFLKTLEGLDSKSRSLALTQMFGAGMDTASITKMVGELGKLQAAMGTATGEAAKGGLGRALAIQTETADAGLKRLGNNFRDIGIAMGAALLPAIKAMADAVGAIAKLIASLVDAAPWLATLASGGAALALSWGALRVALATGALVLAKLGVSFGVAGVAAGGASVGVGLLGAAVRFLLGPVGLAVLAIEGLILVWNKLSDARAKEAARTPADLQAELTRLQQERAEREKQARATGQFGPDQQARMNTLKAREAELQERISQAARQGESKLSEQAGASGGAGDGLEDKADITAKLKAMTEAAQAAAKARLAADREVRAAQAALAADANARELAELQRNLDAETVTIGRFYADKLRLADADAAAQIALKQKDRADLAASDPASDADKETRRGELAKLDAEITKLRRDRADLAGTSVRERTAAELKAQEDALRGTLAIQQRGAEATLTMAQAARAAGEIDAAALAAAEAQAAEARVQLALTTTERILAARQKANAPAAAVRDGQTDVDAARAARDQQRAGQLTAVGDRLRSLKEQTTDIRLNLDTDPARRDIAATEQAVRKLQEQAASDAAVLRVQLNVETDPAQQKRIQGLLDDLTRASIDRQVAENDALAERLKPGWQKMLDGWADVNRLMREGHDELMQGVMRNGEDAFVKFARTGKLSVKSLVDDALNQMLRLKFRELLGGDKGQAGVGWLSKLLGGKEQGKGLDRAAKEGDADFMGPLQQGLDGLSDGTRSASEAMQRSADSSGALGVVFGGLAKGLGTFGNLVLSAAQALATLAASSAGSSAGGLAGLAGLFKGSGNSGTPTLAGTAAIPADLAATGRAYQAGGAVAFAKGGAFTNQVVSSSTLFRFSKGGRKVLGEMGEAGPEAIMPLGKDKSGAQGVETVDERGRALGMVLRLARGKGGRLSAVLDAASAAARMGGAGLRAGLQPGAMAQQLARGAAFAMQAPARFAMGDAFGAASLGGGSGLAGMAGTSGAPSSSGNGTSALHLTVSPVINIDARTDQSQVRQLVNQGVQQAVAQAVNQVADMRKRGNRAL